MSGRVKERDESIVKTANIVGFAVGVPVMLMVILSGCATDKQRAEETNKLMAS